MLTVVSGGQTGADRAALDAAIKAGLRYEGWCPKGGWAEDMPVPPGVLALYPNLRETPSSRPEERTDWNVRDCTGLLVVVGKEGISVSSGTARALAHANELGRAALVVDANDAEARSLAFTFLSSLKSGKVCIAGPRESESKGLYAAARVLLDAVFKDILSAC